MSSETPENTTHNVKLWAVAMLLTVALMIIQTTLFSSLETL